MASPLLCILNLVLGKHRTGTEGVVEARNRSRFPDSSAGPGEATATSGLDEVDEEESSESTRLSASTDSETAAAAASGAAFRLADRGDGDGESEGDEEDGGRRVCRPWCSCWCWRRWGG